MGIVRFALKFPYTFYILAALIVFLGASAVIYFRSDENAELLKSVLNDAATWEHQLVSRGEKRRERVYEVRAEAWSVLDAWGYPASHPVTRIPLPDG